MTPSDQAEPYREVETRRLAAALKRVLENFVATTAPVDVFRHAVAPLERLADALAVYPRSVVSWRSSKEAAAPGGAFEHSPFLGRSNPLAPPILIEVGDERVDATVVFGPVHEGPPGHVHGGFLAAAFDEVLGYTQPPQGPPRMTVRLTIQYRRPTPLHTELRFEGTVDEVDGRKRRVSGRLWNGDELCAEAEAFYVDIDRDKARRLRRLGGADPGSDDSGAVSAERSG